MRNIQILVGKRPKFQFKLGRLGHFVSHLETGGDYRDHNLILQFVIDYRTKDDIGIRISSLSHNSAASFTSNRLRLELPDKLSKIPFAPLMEASNSGLEMACLAA